MRKSWIWILVLWPVSSVLSQSMRQDISQSKSQNISIDTSIEEAIRSLEKIPPRQMTRMDFKLDYEDRDHHFLTYSREETGYQNSTEYVLFSIYVRSKIGALNNISQLYLGRGSDDVQWGKKVFEEKFKYEHERVGLTLQQRIYSLTVSEGVSLHSFKNETIPEAEQKFDGRHVQVDYRATTRSLFPPEVGFHMAGSYDRTPKRVLELKNPLVKDVQTVQGRIDIVAPIWFFESIHRLETIDRKNYGSSQQTLALRWTPSGRATLAESDGSYLSNPSGQIFSQHSWMLIGGIEHIQDDINPKDLLGFLISARMYCPYGDNSHGLLDISYFAPFGHRGYLFKVGMVGGLRDLLYGFWPPLWDDEKGSFKDENKLGTFEIFVDDLYGKDGGQGNFGMAASLEIEY